MSKIKISAIVNTRNEEANIEDCLKSLKFADEIIVVDMESKDKTVKLALKHTKMSLITRMLVMWNQPEILPLKRLLVTGS